MYSKTDILSLKNFSANGNICVVKPDKDEGIVIFDETDYYIDSKKYRGHSTLAEKNILVSV